DYLAIFEKEWNLVTANFENSAGGGTIVPRCPEPGIKKACVMHPKYPHGWVDRNHFGSEIGRDMELFLGGENVELVRIEDQPFVRLRPDFNPIIGDSVVLMIHIENIGVFQRLVADDPVGRFG